MSNGCGEGYHMEGGVCVPDNERVARIESLSARVSYFAIKEVVSYGPEGIETRAEAATKILDETLKRLEGIHSSKAEAKH